jgi:Cytochrome P460
MPTRWLGLILAVAACGDSAAPLFPADYASTYLEVRDCRPSGDHDLRSIRVLADPMARPSYLGRSAPFPAGAVVLKEEYDFGDRSCDGPVVEWTVMRRLPAGEGAQTGGWAWQRVAADRSVVSEDEPRCIGCHQQCGVAPDGHDGTCAAP